MTFIDHGLHYAIPAAFVLRGAGFPEEIVGTGAALSWCINAYPDLGGFLAALVNLKHERVDWWQTRIFGLKVPMRGDVYSRLHSRDHPLWWLWWAHLAVDEPFHHEPGPWWPRLAWLALIYWVQEIQAIAIYFLT
jgi:hypothetical protein